MELLNKNKELYHDVANWLDYILEQKISEEVVAFCFNLYEDGNDKWSMELVGTERFDIEDTEWPCYEIMNFGTRENPFIWKKAASWDIIIKEMVSILIEYLKKGTYGQILKSVDGIGIGFVDGDIEILYSK